MLARAEAEAPALLVRPVPAVELVAAVLARGATEDVLVVPVVLVPVVVVEPVVPLVALPMPLHGATVAEVALAGVPCVIATPATLQFSGTCSWMISTKLKPLPVEVLLVLEELELEPLADAGRIWMNTICGPLLVTLTNDPAMPPLALLVDVPVVLPVVLEPERLLVLVEVEPVVPAELEVPVVVAGRADALAPRPAELLVPVVAPVAPALLEAPRPAVLLVLVVLPTPAALLVPVEVEPVALVVPVVEVLVVARPLVPVAKEPCQLPCVRTC